MNVFAGGYKAFLKSKAQERGALSALAKAAGCQPSYLLRILHEEAHLTPDQAFRLCAHWALPPDEREYFLGLVNHDRSGDPAYRRFLSDRLHELRAAHFDLQNVVERKEADDAQLLLAYHGDWQIALLHFLSACRGYHTREALARRVGLPREELDALLGLLHKHGLVEAAGEKVRYLRGAAHIPKGSPVLPVFLANWRGRAVQKSQRGAPGDVHFSNVQTIGKADLPKLQELARQFIQRAKELCDRSDSEEVVAVNLDVFVP